MELMEYVESKEYPLITNC